MNFGPRSMIFKRRTLKKLIVDRRRKMNSTQHAEKHLVFWNRVKLKSPISKLSSTVQPRKTKS